MDNVNDANTDLTIDFGFFRSVAVGNLVFLDANYNGRADAGEGVGGVTLELYNEGAFIPFDSPVATTTTNSDGTYLFSDLIPGRYFVRVPSSQFDYYSPLYGYASILGTQTGDDNLGEDGLDDASPSVNGIQTAVFELTPTNAPTGSQEGGYQGSSDDIDDASTNLTIDLGFVQSAGVGNVVFNDLNNDGIFDPGLEYGIDGVTVELWSSAANATAPVGSTTTYSGGLYSFNVAPGSYYVRIPVSNFQEGGALANLVPSKPASAGSGVPTSTAGDDDTQQDAYTTGAVLVDGARTAVFTLVPGQSPTFDTTETGYYSYLDDYDDANTDLTIDLGFAPKPLSVGNLIFRDVNSNGHYDSQDFGVAGVKVRLFKVGDNPASDSPVMETTTSIDGTFLLNTYEEGQYFLHIPASQFASGGALFGTTSTPGFGADDGKDDDVDENGLDAADPTSTGVSSTVFDLAYGTEPLATTGESGFLTTQDVYNDEDVDLSIDMGFTGGSLPSLMNIGNLVFIDANNNGMADAGEGVPGVWMLLYAGSGTAGSTSYIRSTTTDSSGRYFFTNLNPGVYTVHVAADNFKASISINGGPVGPGPLYKMLSLCGNQTTTGDDNLGEDGIDSQSPEQGGITAPPVTLTANAAPTGAQEGGFQGSSDDANDANTDLTIDFGFTQRLGVGNLVFRDANADGKFQSGIDTGLAGITVELVFNNGIGGADVVAFTTTTDANGGYFMYAPQAVSPQSYKVRIPAAQFSSTGPLNFMVPTTLTTNGNDDNLNQNAQPASSPETTGAVTAGFTLVAGTLPTDADGREAGYNITSDNAEDASIDLTIDLGFQAKAIMVGNLIFRDANSNGTYESGIDVPLPNVTVRLFQQAQAVTDTPVSEAITAADGTYMLYATSPAAYYVHIPASMFATDAPLYGMTSVTGDGNVQPTTNADTAKDDRFDENGSDATQPDVTGVSSGLINLAYGTMPLNSSVTSTTGENGFQSFMDDAADDSGMMTVDFGFLAGLGSPNAIEIKRNLATNPGTISSPSTFTAWQTQNSLNGLNNPNDDPDADGQTNLLEYALGTAGGSGLGVSRFSLVNNTVTGAIDAVLTRPSGAHADLRYYLEGSNDLTTWTTLALTPATTVNAGQTETLRYSGVEALFSGASRGFLRIKVTLDANLDGTPEATATTGAQGWARMQFAVGRESLSMPLLLPAVYTGQVASVSGRTMVLNINGGDIRTLLQNGVSYYAEVLSGALTGRTMDLDTTASTSSSISLTTSADSALAGARICIRPHWTLGALLPVSGLQPSTTAETADRIMFFDSASGQFQIDWLQTTANSTAQWVRDGDTDLTNDAARIISPQTGMLVQVRSTPATLTFLGEVRSAALALPQTAGTSLLGTGLATPQSPGAQPFTLGSRLRLWSGDTDPSTAVYQNYLLNPQSQWVDETTGLEVTHLPLLDGFRAFFLVKP